MALAILNYHSPCKNLDLGFMVTANETKIDWLRWRALVTSIGVDFAYGKGATCAANGYLRLFGNFNEKCELSEVILI